MLLLHLLYQTKENLGNECENSTIFRKTLVPSLYVTVSRVTDLRFRSNIKENFSKKGCLGWDPKHYNDLGIYKTH